MNCTARSFVDLAVATVAKQLGLSGAWHFFHRGWYPPGLQDGSNPLPSHSPCFARCQGGFNWDWTLIPLWSGLLFRRVPFSDLYFFWMHYILLHQSSWIQKHEITDWHLAISQRQTDWEKSWANTEASNRWGAGWICCICVWTDVAAGPWDSHWAVPQLRLAKLLR